MATMDPNKLEVYLLIFKTLEGGPYKEVADVFRNALEENINNTRVDYLGQTHKGDLNSLLSKYPNINSKTLENMFSYLRNHLDKYIPNSILGINSYLGAGHFSLLRTRESLYKEDVQHSVNTLLSNKHIGPGYKNHSISMLKHLQARKLRGPVCIRKSVPTEIHTRINFYRKLMGHLSSVYCVCFDQTGQYIFTGADDHLIKIWSARDGRLLRTLRGHDGEITDMSVNYENRLLASGGMDKVIRIWDLKSSKLLECLTAHNATVTSVKFAPYNRHENNRYLISTSNDGSVIFWKYKVDAFQFTKYKRFQERTRPGGQIVCCSFSSGGSFLACGSSDNCIHIYGFHPDSGPYWIAELDYHKDQVDSIQFSNQGFRFISGSQDGTAAIWSYKRGQWKPLKLDMFTQLDQTISRPSNEQATPRVLIVQWSQDDRYVMTSIVDYSIKIWDSTTGRLLHILKEHKHDVYLIESHPIDPRIFVSASHDGTMIVWDIERAKIIKKFLNRAESSETHESSTLAQIYDLKFSPDGNMIATTDSYGYLSLYGNGGAEAYKDVPEQLFFHTDYRALIRDMRHFVMDEQTHVAPHLMPKPVLVDMNGNPYGQEYQRFVPDSKNGERIVIPPLNETQTNIIAEKISDHSRFEDEEYLSEKRSPPDDLFMGPNSSRDIMRPSNSNNRAGESSGTSGHYTRYSTRHSFQSAMHNFGGPRTRRTRRELHYYEEDIEEEHVQQPQRQLRRQQQQRQRQQRQQQRQQRQPQLQQQQESHRRNRMPVESDESTEEEEEEEEEEEDEDEEETEEDTEDMTEVETDEETVIDSEATEIDDPQEPEEFHQPRRTGHWALRTRSSHNIQRPSSTRETEGRPVRRYSARIRDRKRFRRI